MTNAYTCPECRYPLTLTGVPVQSGAFGIEYGGEWRYEWFCRCDRCCKGWSAIYVQIHALVQSPKVGSVPVIAGVAI